ncbi:transposase [Hymenobacter busanensis]|nr:transposase [Hymenobacter busanensis]
MNGAQVFETIVFVPKWAASPPETLGLLADKNGVSLKTFWIAFHSLHEVAFMLAIAFCWQLDFVRNWLLVLFAVHFAVRVWTIVYFAPNIMAFERIATAEGADARSELGRRAAHWQTLNYVRVAIFIAVSIALVPLCIEVLRLR